MHAIICSDEFVGAVVFHVGRAFFTFFTQSTLARVALCADAYAVANFDVVFCFGADADGDADDFVADTLGVGCWALEVVDVSLK